VRRSVGFGVMLISGHYPERTAAATYVGHHDWLPLRNGWLLWSFDPLVSWSFDLDVQWSGPFGIYPPFPPPHGIITLAKNSPQNTFFKELSIKIRETKELSPIFPDVSALCGVALLPVLW